MKRSDCKEYWLVKGRWSSPHYYLKKLRTFEYTKEGWWDKNPRKGFKFYSAKEAFREAKKWHNTVFNWREAFVVRRFKK